MELLTGKTENFTARDIVEVEDFLMKKMGFTGVKSYQVSGDWVISAEDRKSVIPAARKSKAIESSPSDPADAN